LSPKRPQTNRRCADSHGEPGAAGRLPDRLASLTSAVLPVGRRLVLRIAGIGVIVVVALACVLTPASAAATPEAQIKAGIVFNLALVVDWPEAALAGDSFVIGVVGSDDADPAFAHLAGKDVHQRPLVLRDPLPVSALDRAQVVYISRAEPARVAELLALLAGHPVLTVSDLDGFCEAGGMVQLQRDRNRIQLRVNRGAAERAGLRLSSQLLKVAEIVEGGD
jgi:hypothetical protein